MALNESVPSISRRISRRNLLTTGAQLGATLAVGAAVAGPIAGTVEAVAPARRMKRAPLATTTIKLSVWADVQDLTVYKNIIKDFEAAQHEIKVVPEQWTGDYYAKLQTVLAAGTAPDVVYFQPWEWQPYAIDGVLRPLDDFIRRDRSRVPNLWTRAYASSTQWNGKHYLAPADSSPMVIFYLKEMFDKARVPYPKEGWTLDDFVATAKELTVKKGGKVVQYGYQPNYGDPYYRNFGWMRLGGHLESSPLIKPKKANFADPQVVKALQMQLYDLPKKGIALPLGALLAGGGGNIGANFTYGIQNGLAAMKLEGPWFMPQLMGSLAVKKGGLPFDVVSAPRQGSRWSAPAGMNGHAIMAQSKNPDAAWELVKFIIGGQGQRRIAEGGRSCNSAETIQKTWYPIAHKLYGFKNYQAWQKTVAADNLVETGGVTSDQILVKGGMNSSVQAIGAYSQTAAQAMSSVNQQVQALYDAWWRSHPNG